MKAAAKTAAAKKGAGGNSSSAQPTRKPDMLKSGVKLEDLTGQDLIDYAKSAGVPGHVIASMTEVKLRHECLLRVHAFLEQLDD
jgi:hypothetical protein